MSTEALTGMPFADLDCVHWLEIQEPEPAQPLREAEEPLPAATLIEEVPSA